MRIIALTIVVLIALIAFGGSLASKQTGIVTSDEHDYRKVEPFRGSEVGNTLARACGDCHSNQASFPWYGHVAPVSWWIKGYIREGREELNLSEWMRYSPLERHNELEIDLRSYFERKNAAGIISGSASRIAIGSSG
jgi:Haem-binding domain